MRCTKQKIQIKTAKEDAKASYLNINWERCCSSTFMCTCYIMQVSFAAHLAAGNICRGCTAFSDRTPHADPQIQKRSVALVLQTTFINGPSTWRPTRQAHMCLIHPASLFFQVAKVRDCQSTVRNAAMPFPRHHSIVSRYHLQTYRRPS